MLHYDCYLSVLFVQSCAIRACVSFLVYVVCIACFSCAVSCSVFICLYHNMLVACAVQYVLRTYGMLFLVRQHISCVCSPVLGRTVFLGGLFSVYQTMGHLGALL